MQRASFWSWLDVVDDYYCADLGDLENVNLIVGREYPFHPKLYRVSAEGETDVSDDPDGYYRFNSYGTFEFYQDGESLGFEGVVDLGAEITIVPMYDGELYLELNFYDAYVQSFELHADYCRHEDVVYENGYPATCTEPGYTDGVYCPTCGEVTAQEEIPALGHDWNDGEIVIDDEGKTEKVYTCGVCGERYSELIPDTDDNLKISCTSVTLKNDLSMNFYVNPDDSQDVEIDYLLVTKDVYDAAGNVIDTVTLRIDHYTVRDGYRVYTFPNISAKEMTAKLTAELFGTNSDGSEYHGQAVRTSVQRYAMQLLNPEATGTEAQLLNKTVVNMLLYGDRAQEYMNYNLTHKASSGLTADALALAGNEAVTYEGHMGLTGTGRKDVKFNSVALVLRNKVELKYYLDVANFGGDVNNLKLVLTYDGKTKVISGSEFVRASGTVYGVCFSDLTAAQMRTAVTATVQDETDTAISSMLLRLAYSRLDSAADAFDWVLADGDLSAMEAGSFAVQHIGQTVLDTAQVVSVTIGGTVIPVA